MPCRIVGLSLVHDGYGATEYAALRHPLFLLIDWWHHSHNGFLSHPASALLTTTRFTKGVSRGFILCIGQRAKLSPNHRRSRWWDNPNSPVARLTDRGHYSDSGFHYP